MSCYVDFYTSPPPLQKKTLFALIAMTTDLVNHFNGIIFDADYDGHFRENLLTSESFDLLDLLRLVAKKVTLYIVASSTKKTPLLTTSSDLRVEESYEPEVYYDLVKKIRSFLPTPAKDRSVRSYVEAFSNVTLLLHLYPDVTMEGRRVPTALCSPSVFIDYENAPHFEVHRRSVIYTKFFSGIGFLDLAYSKEVSSFEVDGDREKIVAKTNEIEELLERQGRLPEWSVSKVVDDYEVLALVD